MSGSFDAVVIGAGANGLVAATALGRAGLRVLVLERGESAGGQSRAFEFAPGYRVAPLALDAGWAPPAMAQRLGLSGLEVVRPSTPLTILVEPGEFLPLPADVRGAADAIGRHSARDASNWARFVARLRKLAGFLEVLYTRPAPAVEADSVRELRGLLAVARSFRRLGREDMVELLRLAPMSVQQIATDAFESEPLRAAVAASGVRDLRQGPWSGGTGFVLLHHLAGATAGALRRLHGWRAGPDAFTTVIARAASGRGVTIRTGAEVDRIQVHDDAIAAVVLRDGEEIRAARVLSSADPARTLLGMVDPVWLDPELLLALRNIRFRGCTAFVLYALAELPELPGVEHSTEVLKGVVSLTPDLQGLERAGDAAKYGRVPDRPHVELSAPSEEWPALAPEGRHVLVARVQYAPWRLREGAEWDAHRAEALGDTVTQMIEEAVPCFSSRVLHRAVLSPRDLEERYGLTEGTPSHGELGLDQILFMRPLASLARYATPIEGLYLCGAGAHPGPGVLGGAGWLAARRVLDDAGRRTPLRST